MLKKYYYDYDTLGKYNTNYHGHRYIKIPNDAEYTHQSVSRAGGGWNYKRYQVVSKIYGDRIFHSIFIYIKEGDHYDRT